MSRPILVKEIRNICVECPSKWQGTTLDGSEFRAFYDFGKLHVDVDGANLFATHINFGQGEFLSYETLKSQIRHLAVLPDSVSEVVDETSELDEMLFDEF